MLLINRFIRLVENHAESLSLNWVNEVRSNPLTEGYAKMSKDALHDIVYTRFRKIGDWLGNKEDRDRHIAQLFVDSGAEMQKADIKASEMVYTLMLERDLLWKYILDEGIVTEGIDLNRAIEFSLELNYFYEKAIYFSVVGYENQMKNQSPIKDDGHLHKTFEGFKHWIIVK
jgi:hypothetical protein